MGRRKPEPILDPIVSIEIAPVEEEGKYECPRVHMKLAVSHVEKV